MPLKVSSCMSTWQYSSSHVVLLICSVFIYSTLRVIIIHQVFVIHHSIVFYSTLQITRVSVIDIRIDI
jgi:hypothetical protein